MVAEPEKEVMPTLEELGIGFVPYSPLGRGFLTGKMDENTKFDSSDFRNALPRFTPEARKANQGLVDVLAALAAKQKATPAQFSRSRGCLRRNPGSFRFPARPGSSGCRRTLERPPSTSRQKICPRSMQRPRRLRCMEIGIRSTWSK